jgi:hypothetical protein
VNPTPQPFEEVEKVIDPPWRRKLLPNEHLKKMLSPPDGKMIPFGTVTIPFVGDNV